ncbi:hypothetical protein [uncultured Chryseobacterium sp.]|jgi:hypothetical protein|uniref:hypothetical protein n=1 Tax=uncultured Chryseobacterium sp. TaxID=259322 RepID=UPI0026132531|nr:hypothetical protein [uncultured Chryseobacterium sp.]
MRNVMRLSVATVFLFLFSCTKEKTVDQELKEAAAGMNKLTPQMLNDMIRLDSVSTEPDKILKYNYTLMEDERENVSEEDINAFKNEAKQEALNAVKTSADMQQFKEDDVTLKYVYYDKNGKLTADFSITPSEYKK